MTHHTSDCHLNDVGDISQTLDELRVLVVDNDLDSRILIRLILESFNFEVLTVSSVMEAVKVIRKFHPNLLISELVLPKINGYTLIRKVRNLPAPLGLIPAIVLTAIDSEEERYLSLISGFQAYLIKPVDSDNLIVEIQKVLALKEKFNSEFRRNLTDK